MRARPSPPQRPGRGGRARRPRVPGLFAVLVLVPGLALSGTLYLRLKKDVRLVVDGEQRAVSTFGSTVGDLLSGQGIALDRHDEVTPTPEAGLTDGMKVQVLLAKEITLLLDGAERTVFVTGETVRDVLEQINVRAERDASIEPSRGATIEEGDVIVYESAVDVRLIADGRSRQVITNAADVGYLLDSLGLTLRKDDRVEPPIRTPLSQGMDIRVVRVAFREVVEDQAIPFATQIQKTSDLLIGQRQVAREGVTGLRRSVYEAKTENGNEVSRKLLSTRVIREPVAQVILEGTRPPHVETGAASWYQRSGMVAAHRTLPFGTEVRVTSLANGRSVTVIINDRGPFIGGRIIDLSDDAFAQLAPLGAGTIPVRITW